MGAKNGCYNILPHGEIRFVRPFPYIIKTVTINIRSKIYLRAKFRPKAILTAAGIQENHS